MALMLAGVLAAACLVCLALQPLVPVVYHMNSGVYLSKRLCYHHMSSGCAGITYVYLEQLYTAVFQYNQSYEM